MDCPNFETLVNLHYEDLYRFAFSLARTPDDACDLTQQAFAVYAEKGHQIREADRIKSWLFTTLYREFLRSRNRDNRHVSIDSTENEVPEPSVESTAGRQTEQAELMHALADLDEGQRAILSLFYLEQISYKEIAEILDIPIGTVMSRLSRAKESLRKKLESSESTGGIKVIPIDSHKQRKEVNG